jgi:hypothetical protein
MHQSERSVHTMPPQVHIVLLLRKMMERDHMEDLGLDGRIISICS